MYADSEYLLTVLSFEVKNLLSGGVVRFDFNIKCRGASNSSDNVLQTLSYIPLRKAFQRIMDLNLDYSSDSEEETDSDEQLPENVFYYKAYKSDQITRLYSAKRRRAAGLWLCDAMYEI